ncbi:response regulator transcription factor [Clostridium oryzae]|uniref:Stage 0 sporulation protein A homolog n=1 Tax=Clostridium oryzae TaxID=1450648 RepID=A0A1V4IJ35_9CLOT|nr:response regulator [Clostridium oryzae]OPJ59860.1 putative response regulatory protein [Clostridium oryzae]
MNSMNLKLLVIDDEQNTRNLIKMLLDWEAMGFSIIGEAASGQEGLYIAEDTKPDLIITDIRMPYMDGLEFCGLIKEHHPQIKIIILTAYEEFEYAKQALKKGASDFLLKPLKRSELKEAIEKIKITIEREEENRRHYDLMKKRLSEVGFENDDFIDVKPSKINEIISYISQNISDSTLTLSSLAAHFYINPSYLSRIFKQQKGANLVEYLTRMRIQEAIAYFNETDKMAYEVAELVGIPDPKYFGKCFKKYTGYTINDYKRKILNNQFSTDRVL